MAGDAPRKGLRQNLLSVPARPILGLTSGDPSGVGPELITRCLADPGLPDGVDFRLIGRAQGHTPGRPTPASARAAWDALEEAARFLQDGTIQAVVTGPVHKESLHAVGFPFPGQTEFFAARSGTENFAMCLTGGPLTVALATIHVPLREVAGALTTAEIVRAGKLLQAFQQKRLGRAPRLAVAGLNPHAGESGKFGDEEQTIIAPAVRELAARGDFTGPLSPDTVFHRAAAGEFDGVLCMYHDQGLIPLKLLAFDTGVNVTLGLPFPRTSPDHGTAFDLAGTGRANHRSLLAAINLAADLLRPSPANP
jgi:4-hydroxythreonine-4-phosphate dehydrogenase